MPPVRTLFAAALASISIVQPHRSFSADSYPNDMRERVQACAACHGAEGRGTNDVYFPRLAGKPSGYLYNQLLAFKAGRRKYPPMNYLLAFLPNSYLKQMADYFADRRPPLTFAAVPEVSQSALEHGHTLVTQGDLARSIPACVGCHGGALTGQEPAIPGLLGLRAAYISAQLGAWRYGTRTAKTPDCMQLVAARLTENDVRAIAAYLSSQPLPKDPAPAAKESYALPFACGSQPEGGQKR